MSIFYKVLFLVVFLFSNNLFAGTIDPDTPDHRYINYGENFPNVVKLICFDGEYIQYGSAVILNKHWIITAAHVVQNQDVVCFNLYDKKYFLSYIIIHKDFIRHSKNIDNPDMALAYSEKEIPISNNTALYTANDETGKFCTIVGWGLTGNFNTGLDISILPDKKRRAGNNHIDSTRKGILLTSASKKNEKYADLEFLTCLGDSGGALYIDNKLAGINIGMLGSGEKDPANSNYGDIAVHARISEYHVWISEIINK